MPARPNDLNIVKPNKNELNSHIKHIKKTLVQPFYDRF